MTCVRMSQTSVLGKSQRNRLQRRIVHADGGCLPACVENVATPQHMRLPRLRTVRGSQPLCNLLAIALNEPECAAVGVLSSRVPEVVFRTCCCGFLVTN